MRCRVIAQGSLLLLLVTVFHGCAAAKANFENTSLQPMEPSPSIPYHSILVNVEANTPEQVFEEVNKITQQLVQRLQEMNIVSQVGQTYESEVADGELLIHLTISDLRKVGGGKRFLIGIFAGKAQITSNVEFFCGDAQRVIGSYEVRAESTSQGETNDVIRAAVDGVVDILKETYNIVEG